MNRRRSMITRLARVGWINRAGCLIWRGVRTVCPWWTHEIWFPLEGPCRIRVPGLRKKLALIGSGENAAVQRLFWEGIGSHEKNELEIFIALARDARTVLDIGANIGLYSLLVALERPHARIHAFEPVQETFDILQEHVHQNKLDKIQAHALALTDHDGRVPMFIPEQSGKGAVDASLLRGFRQDAVEVTVAGMRLDSVLERHGIVDVDLVKIDAEGAEHLVLAGAQECIARWRPVMMVEILQNADEKRLRDIMGPHGYRFLRIEDSLVRELARLSVDRSGRHRNCLFVPPEKFEMVRETVAAGRRQVLLSPAGVLE